MAWKLSVVEAVSDFSRGYSYRTTLSTDFTSGKTIAVSKSYSFLYLQRGDIIKIGPSSHSNSLGKHEFARVFNVSGSSITFVANLSYDYKSGDSVEGIGHAIAEGWDVAYNSTAGTFSFQGIFPKGGSDGVVQQGYLGAVGAQRIKKVAGTSGAIWYSMPTRNQLLSLASYRLMGYIKNSAQIGSTTFRVNDGIAYIVAMSIPSTYGDWLKFEGVGVTSVDLGGSSFLIEFRFNYDNAFGYFLVGAVYLTHALMTNGQSSGVYSFPIDPVNVDRINEEKDRGLLARYSNVIYTGSLNVFVTRGYRMLFADADIDFVRQLEIFQYWQSQGSLLLLESDISTEKPLIGFMDYKPRFVHWDLNRVSIDFIFRGI